MSETVADILREMRKFADTDSQTIGRDVLRRCIQNYCDRIEAAHKREMEVSKRDGNGAEIGMTTDERAELKDLLEGYYSTLRIIDHKLLEQNRNDMRFVVAQRRVCYWITKLSAPARNCDIGSADEQSRRFGKFCFAHKTCEHGCGDCPLVKYPSCALAWAQMPYEEGDAK